MKHKRNEPKDVLQKAVIRTVKFPCPHCGDDIRLPMTPMRSGRGRRTKGGSKDRGFIERIEKKVPSIMKMLDEGWTRPQIISTFGQGEISKGEITKIKKYMLSGDIMVNREGKLVISEKLRDKEKEGVFKDI